MTKANILNLLLLAVVIILAAIIFNTEQPDNKLARLTDVDPDSIRTIQIRHNDNSTTISRQDKDRWSITQPIIIGANNFRISSLLKLLNAPIHARYDRDELDPSTVGLADPVTRITFHKHDIAFGIINPATELRYIMKDGVIFTIEDVYFPMITSHFGTLVAFDLLPEDAVIEKIILPGQTIEKDDRGLWRNDIGSEADSIVTTVEHWSSVQAFGVHEYLQRKDLGEVSIYLKGSDMPVTFQITDNDPWLVLARPELGIEYHLEQKLYDQLIQPR